MKNLFSVLILIISGCATLPPNWINAYEGHALPDEQVAKLIHNFSNYREVVYIDGAHYIKSYGDARNHFNLLPGIHEIQYYLRWHKEGFVVGTARLEMKAGHVYVLSHDVHGGWLPKYQYATVIIRDETTSEVVHEDTFIEPTYYEP